MALYSFKILLGCINRLESHLLLIVFVSDQFIEQSCTCLDLFYSIQIFDCIVCDYWVNPISQVLVSTNK